MKKIFSIWLVLLIGLTANAQQWGLYTLYAPVNSTQTYLIDTNGTTYKTWTSSSSAKTGFSVYLTSGDTLVRAVTYSSNQLTGLAALTGKVQKVLWDGTVVWDYIHSSSTYCLHHDICPMPNGNVLMIAYETKTGADAVQAGCSSSTVIYPEKIIEVHPTGATTGTIVWEWHLWDHLCQNHDIAKDNYVSSIIDNTHLMNINYNPTKDWWHMNGIDYNPTLDQIVVTSRAMNEFFIIDHSTTTAEAAGHTGGNGGKGGDFLYRWGNPASYGASGTANYDVVHYPTWIGPDNPNYPNHICTFNNNGGAGGKSCVDVIMPPYNGYNYLYTPGQVIPPATYAYRHTSTKNTPMNGSAQALPNGNFLNLICSQNYIYEINSAGTELWNKTVSGQPANAVRYDKCYVRGPIVTTAVSSTIVCPGDEVILNSTATSVTETNPTYTFAWSSGQNTQSTTANPTTNTTYVVTVTNTAIGCSNTASVTVDVYALPSTPVITQVGSTLSSTVATSYQWYENGSVISGATSQSYNPLNNGGYQVEITDVDGCTAISGIFTYTASGINITNDNKSITIYPNPTSGAITIKGIDKGNLPCELSVYDLCGKMLLKSNRVSDVDISSLENGIYYVIVISGEVKLNKKIILIK